jgi:hypothetical protein
MANWSRRVSAERQRTKEGARSARHLSLKNRRQQGPWARGPANAALAWRRGGAGRL